MANVRSWVSGVLSTVLLGPLSGCFWTETSYPLDPAGVVIVSQPPPAVKTVRQWLAHAHKDLQHLLPPRVRRTLLTDDLTRADGRPIDMPARLKIQPDRLETFWYNFLGLSYSAQAISTKDDTAPAPPWEDFEDVWVPISDDVSLAGRLGTVRGPDGRATKADCIVILPGLVGTNNIIRLHDLARGLVDSGYHVLSLELRGLGQTDARYPHVAHTWGVRETGDLLIVAQWLQRKPQIRRTGLVGFSWSANIALLTAWADGRGENHPSIPPKIARRLRPRPPGRCYEAGIIAYSPLLDVEALGDVLERPHSFLLRPVMAGLQRSIRKRKIHRKYLSRSGSLRELFTRYHGLGYLGAGEDCTQFLRLLPYRGKPAGDKLEAARVPVLIVYAADDPMGPVQTVADLMATVDNPNVAAIVLPSGGHIGFAPFARDWYYSMMLSFFDPRCGVAAQCTAAASGPPSDAAPSLEAPQRRLRLDRRPAVRQALHVPEDPPPTSEHRASYGLESR